MKRAVLALAGLCFVGAWAEGPSPFLSGDALNAEVARKCEEGCWVVSHEEMERLTQAVNAMLAERSQRAFEVGFGQGSKSCRNAI